MDPTPDAVEVGEPPGPGRPPSWRSRLDQVADATGTTPARIAVGGALLALAVAAGVWATRPPEDPVELSLPYASTTVAAEAPVVDAEPEAVVVHVAGAVAHPGVYELGAGARVIDAVTAAGGLGPGADERQLNLAAPVEDGSRVHVPVEGEDPLPEPVGSPGGPAGGASSGGPVDLNRADAAALEALPGVGPATAAAILEHRERIGRFTSVEQLLDVRGIGEAKLAALRDLVRVS